MMDHESYVECFESHLTLGDESKLLRVLAADDDQERLTWNYESSRFRKNHFMQPFRPSGVGGIGQDLSSRWSPATNYGELHRRASSNSSLDIRSRMKGIDHLCVNQNDLWEGNGQIPFAPKKAVAVLIWHPEWARWGSRRHDQAASVHGWSESLTCIPC